jgi:hypothetical protein
VYLWDLDDGFAGCFLIKKAVQGHKYVSDGSWDSIHVVRDDPPLSLLTRAKRAKHGV